jgi:hypothetical protein
MLSIFGEINININLNFSKNWKKWAKITYFVYFFYLFAFFMYPLNLGKSNLAILKGEEPAVSQILRVFQQLK